MRVTMVVRKSFLLIALLIWLAVPIARAQCTATLTPNLPIQRWAGFQKSFGAR